MAEQNLDIRFNPALRKACSADIPKFCLKVVIIIIIIIIIIYYLLVIMFQGIVLRAC